MSKVTDALVRSWDATLVLAETRGREAGLEAAAQYMRDRANRHRALRTMGALEIAEIFDREAVGIRKLSGAPPADDGMRTVTLRLTDRAIGALQARLLTVDGETAHLNVGDMDGFQMQEIIDDVLAQIDTQAKS